MPLPSHGHEAAQETTDEAGRIFDEGPSLLRRDGRQRYLSLLGTEVRSASGKAAGEVMRGLVTTVTTSTMLFHQITTSFTASRTDVLAITTH